MIKFSGRVIHGKKLGRRLGFPTANLDRREFARRKLQVRFGVWGGYVFLRNGERFAAGIVVGPKDKRGLPKLEAHLLRFSGRLYGQTVSLELRKFVRPYKKFSDLGSLQAQIIKDLRKIKASL